MNNGNRTGLSSEMGTQRFNASRLIFSKGGTIVTEFRFERDFNIRGADFSTFVTAIIEDDVISISSVKIGDTEIKQDLPKEFIDKLESEAEYEWNIILKGAECDELE